VILHLAARQRTRYEWEEHVPMALAAGVSEGQVARIEDNHGVDTEDPVFSAAEVVAVGFADHVLAGSALGGERWDAAARLWGPQGALDLLMTVGVWGAMVPTVVRGLGLRHVE
jgi:hypothetical protein